MSDKREVPKDMHESAAGDLPRLPGNVGIVGGTGFIGSRITALFAANGWATKVFTLEDPLVSPDGHLAEHTDVLDVLVWSASRTTPASAAHNPDLARREFDEVQMTLQAVRQRNPRLHIVFLSSGGTVYGNGRQAHREDEPLDPTTPYARLKVELEELFLMSFDRATVLRVANAYGPGQGGASAQGVLAHWLPAILDDKPLEVFGNPLSARDYVYVDDIAEALYATVQLDSRSRRYSVFNVGAGISTSLEELLDVVRYVTGEDIKVRYEPSRGFDLISSHLDTTRICSQTLWRPRTSLCDGVSAMWDWVCSRASVGAAEDK